MGPRRRGRVRHVCDEPPRASRHHCVLGDEELRPRHPRSRLAEAPARAGRDATGERRAGVPGGCGMIFAMVQCVAFGGIAMSFELPGAPSLSKAIRLSAGFVSAVHGFVWLL